MTWPALEKIIDKSNLSLLPYAVLKAFSRHVNAPSDERPYPLNMVIWPAMETLADHARCSVYMVQRAKQALVKDGILEPVENQGPWRRHTPRYQINKEKIQQDDAALERERQRQARRHKSRHPPEAGPEKGSQICKPLPPKGSQICPPEFLPVVRT
jgi:hypothetical protein